MCQIYERIILWICDFRKLVNSFKLIIAQTAARKDKRTQEGGGGGVYSVTHPMGPHSLFFA